MAEIIRQMEERSMNAWPSLQTILDDGWVIRLANGYTKRCLTGRLFQYIILTAVKNKFNYR